MSIGTSDCISAEMVNGTDKRKNYLAQGAVVHQSERTIAFS